MEHTEPDMVHESYWGLSLGAILLGGCAKANVETTRAPSGVLPKPDYIWVSDFAVTPQEVALDRGASARLGRELSATSQTEEERSVGQAVAAALTKHLVEELRDYGISAYRASEAPLPSATTASIRGQFLHIDMGDRTLRTLVGFGLGGSQVVTRIQVYQGVGPNERLVAEAETSTQSSLKPVWVRCWVLGRRRGRSPPLQQSAAVRRWPARRCLRRSRRTPNARRRCRRQDSGLL